jgi:ATP-binding cassette, subfamily B (MDR/TAP), member 1
MELVWYLSRSILHSDSSSDSWCVNSLILPAFDYSIAQSTTFGAIQAGNVFAFVPDVSSAKGAASDIIKLMDQVPEIDAESSAGKKVETKTIQGHIRLENIHFRYPTRPGVRVLRELSLQAEPGNYIALVGASGSGKSTV